MHTKKDYIKYREKNKVALQSKKALEGLSCFVGAYEESYSFPFLSFLCLQIRGKEGLNKANNNSKLSCEQVHFLSNYC